MDLTSFTNTKEEQVKKEVLVDNLDVKIVREGDEVEFYFKKADAVSKYQDFLFFSPTNSKIVSTEEETEEFFKQSIDDGTEGLMVKSLDAFYKSGLRSGAMAKLKETKEDIDVVILGAEHGKGKRAGYYSSFYIGIRNEDYNDESDMFLGVGKVSSGIKELSNEDDSASATMERLTELLKPLKVSEDKGVVWFEPKIVIQVRYQEIQKSIAYDSGYALRFPRIIALREKGLFEVNTIEDLESFI